MHILKGLGVGLLISTGILLISYFIIKSAVDTCINCGFGAAAPAILGAFMLCYILPAVIVASTYIGYKKWKKYIMQVIIRLIVGFLLAIGISIVIGNLHEDFGSGDLFGIFLVIPLPTFFICMFLPEVTKNKAIARLLPF